MKDDRLQLSDLRDRFNTHTEWHCYRNYLTGKVFAQAKPKEGRPGIEKIGTANGCCHRTALKAAKAKPLPIPF